MRLRLRLKLRPTVAHHATAVGEVLAAHVAERRVGGAVADAAVARHVRQAGRVRRDEGEGALVGVRLGLG